MSPKTPSMFLQVAYVSEAAAVSCAWTRWATNLTRCIWALHSKKLFGSQQLQATNAQRLWRLSLAFARLLGPARFWTRQCSRDKTKGHKRAFQKSRCNSARHESCNAANHQDCWLNHRWKSHWLTSHGSFTSSGGCSPQTAEQRATRRLRCDPRPRFEADVWYQPFNHKVEATHWTIVQIFF